MMSRICIWTYGLFLFLKSKILNRSELGLLSSRDGGLDMDNQTVGGVLEGL